MILRKVGIRIDVVCGTTLYGLGLVVLRLLQYAKLWIWRVTRHAKDIRIPQVHYKPRLSGLEIFLTDAEIRPTLRIDLDKYHTLIAGITGAGKTSLLNYIIYQLVSRPDTLVKYDIHLFDLKHHKGDWLHLWQPVTNYYPSTLGTTAILDKLEELASNLQNNSKRLVIIIDEVAELTAHESDAKLRSRAVSVLHKVAAQLRSAGAVVFATQRPQFESIPRNITSQLERKICLRMESQNDGRQLVMRSNSIPYSVDSLAAGEFVLKEPGHRTLYRKGYTPLLNLPGDIDKVVSQIIGIQAEEDTRLQLLVTACQGLKPGQMILGINKIVESVNMTAEEVKHAYRNFALAGAFRPKLGKNSVVRGYVLANDYGQAVVLVLDYIKAGKWQSAPESVNG